MKSAEIRKTFLNFFEKNNHKVIHSSSLVPQNDPTLMFANSGMVQFKNVFTGKESRDYNRAVTSQKCVRAGGKHNDLENVGYTARHHTFFEMLGNFSFGDYFKDIAIEFAWKLITQEFGINKNKLLVTVFNEDEEAYILWKKIAGLSEDKIIKIDTSDNFWSMGESGPCGPCSEIFYDHGDKYVGGPPGSANPDGDRFIEIWNLVFMQFEQITKDKRENLPKPSIDTGMGLERITALLQNTNDNYSTDIFAPLMLKSIELTNFEENRDSASHRVIADHLRSAAFLISDGVLPSNEGRGYVLRRIMRRGMRHAHSLGNKDPIFHKIFPILLNEMKEAYPELLRANDLISNILLDEETKFKQTIDNGLKILEDEINNTSNNIFSGEIAFRLYDTFGFPLDLTQDYLKNKNITVDVDQFNKKMQLQKDRARKSWKGTGDLEDKKIWFQVTESLEITEFLGYENVTSEGIIKKIICESNEVTELFINQEGGIILNQTPFYGESGGQIGDSGKISNEKFVFEVTDTIKLFGNYILHLGKLIKGVCNLNDEVISEIDIEKRELIKNNHSATHLLHASLRYILGTHITQKGSLVSSDKLRFDFSHNKPIETEDLIKIEKLVNKVINQNNKINIKILDHQSAINEGAMALFGEKYGDQVRVVSMGEVDNNYFSKELCGGTHTTFTGNIEKFKIINESSIASGIRRIEALTNIKIDEYLETRKKHENEKLKKINEQINIYLKLINENNQRVELNLDEYVNPEDKLRYLKNLLDKINEKKSINLNKQNINIENINNYKFIYLSAEDYPSKNFKTFIDEQKKNNKKSIIVLASASGSKVSIIIGITEDILDKFDAKSLILIASVIVGGKGGGGRKDMAQSGGNNKYKIPEMFEALKNEIKKTI